jgi:predicted peroxiredoxin
MPEIKNLLILVNTGMDKAYNQYASYIVAFAAKKIAKIPEVTIFYGPQGIEVAKKGNLVSLKIGDSVKKLIADQIEGLSPEDLPNNLEEMARFVKDELGVKIMSCGTFHVIDGFAKSIDDKSEIENFITPAKLPDAANGLLGADRILYY